MEIVAHRGFWKIPEEKNTYQAFKNALDNGFGIETDFRDFNGTLVISHDIPTGSQMSVEDFFKLYSSYPDKSWLALNIKADGLQKQLKELIDKYSIENYFCFDMSIPDTIGYVQHGLNIFSRRSEYEVEMPFYKDSTGVWLDCFKSDWITKDEIEKHVNARKYACIVSAELHKRNHNEIWGKYKSDSENVLICTDYPDKAKEFFNE